MSFLWDILQWNFKELYNSINTANHFYHFYQRSFLSSCILPILVSKILIIIFYSSKENKVKDNQDHPICQGQIFKWIHKHADLYTKVMLGHVFSHRDDIWVTKTIFCTWYIIKTTGRKIKTIKDGIHMLDSNLTLSSSKGIHY